MGLAASQARLLTLTARKADCEYNISIDSMKKMALTREQSDLSKQYYSKLQAKKISYYANGKYNKMNYQYLMGYGANYTAILSGNMPLKDKNNVILTDSSGRVVLSSAYAKAISSVVGSNVVQSDGHGGTFSKDYIPAILADFIPGFTEEQFKAAINNTKIDSSYNATTINTKTGTETGKTVVDNTDTNTSKIQQIVDFYYPIFLSAGANGWTTEYEDDIRYNEDYISDALVSGSFQLSEVNDEGGYDPNTSLTYFVTSGLVQERTDSDVREEVTAWYNAEKERISEKENWIDIEMGDLSTELEAINTEIQAVKTLIDDAIQTVFDWGSG